MTPQQMLEELSAAGDSTSDYNDGLNGWFSWNIDTGPVVSTLRISWQPLDEGYTDSGKPGEKTTLTWLIAGPMPLIPG